MANDNLHRNLLINKLIAAPVKVQIVSGRIIQI